MYLLLQISYVEVFLEEGVGFCVPPGCAPLCPRDTIDTGNLIRLPLKRDQKVLNEKRLDVRNSHQPSKHNNNQLRPPMSYLPHHSGDNHCSLHQMRGAWARGNNDANFAARQSAAGLFPVALNCRWTSISRQRSVDFIRSVYKGRRMHFHFKQMSYLIFHFKGSAGVFAALIDLQMPHPHLEWRGERVIFMHQVLETTEAGNKSVCLCERTCSGWDPAPDAPCTPDAPMGSNWQKGEFSFAVNRAQSSSRQNASCHVFFPPLWPYAFTLIRRIRRTCMGSIA